VNLLSKRCWLIPTLAVLAASSPALANWPPQPSVNLPIATDPTALELRPQLCGDGAGGAITAWISSVPSEYRATVRAQRVDRTGNLLWPAGGVLLSDAPGYFLDHAIVSDGAGGAIVAWLANPKYPDPTGNIIRLQRISAEGLPLWTSQGVEVAGSLSADWGAPLLASDGQGGAFVGWIGFQPTFDDVFVQRYDASGAAQWSVPVSVSESAVQRSEPVITSDGEGGAVIAWGQGFSLINIVAQRLDRNGQRLWGESGVALCDEEGYRQNPAVGNAGNGSAVVVWSDDSNVLYARKIDGAGSVQWAANGIPVGSPAGFAEDVVGDGAGGVFVCWYSDAGAVPEVFVQHLGADGGRWAPEGTNVGGPSLGRVGPRMIADGVGGVITAWSESVLGSPQPPGSTYPSDCRAQRFDVSGQLLWGPNGALVSNAPGAQSLADMTSDGDEGAILAWVDTRNGNYDVYAQHVNRMGKLGPPARPADRGPATIAIATPASDDFVLEAPHPNPMRGSSQIRFNFAGQSQVTVAVLDVSGHRVRVLFEGMLGSGAHEVGFDGRDSRGRRLPAGVYLVSIHSGKIQQTKRVVML